MKKTITYSNKQIESSNKAFLSRLAAAKKNGMPNEEIFSKLLDSDEHERNQKNALNTGSAIIKETSPGVLEFSQYPIAQYPDAKESKVRLIQNVTQVTTAKGMSWYRAVDNEGRKYISHRYMNVDSYKHGQIQIRYFEEYAYSSDESEFSDSDFEPISLLREDLTREEHNNITQIEPKIKSGKLTLNPEHLRLRDENPTRSATQNKIMGEAAIESYRNFLAKYKDLLSPRFIWILQRAIKASLFITPEKYFRPEWLHRIGHALSLISEKIEDDPQQRSNLGSAGAWANTEMMLLERLAKWFCLSEAEAKVTINPIFQMLFDSELIEKIHFEVDVDIRGEFIRFIQDIDVFKEYPAFLKTSDFAQSVMLVDNLLKDIPPIYTNRVGFIAKKPKMRVTDYASANDGIISEDNVSPEEINALQILASTPDYQVCKRIREEFPLVVPSEPFHKVIILDTETTGLDPSAHELIELAMICCAFSKQNKRFLGVLGVYEGLNQPKIPVSSEVTRITGITNEQLANQTISWDVVREMLRNTKYVVCHNARFDRAFLENHAPDDIANIFKVSKFACTLEHIDWYKRGFDPRKLDYLNFKLGYFYEAHRALSDCFATLNILLNVQGAYAELVYNAHKFHMFHFSNRLIGQEKQANSVPEDDLHGSGSEKMPSLEEVDKSYNLLASISEKYKIYRCVPKPNMHLEVNKLGNPIFVVVNLKTTSTEIFTNQITELSLLTFSQHNEELLAIDEYVFNAKSDRQINWDRVVAILKIATYLVSHNGEDRKVLEANLPPAVSAIVKSKPYASIATDINWQKWKAANHSLKYLSFVFGFYFDPDCIVSQNHAIFNLLKVVAGAYIELETKINQEHTVILLNGPVFSSIKLDLKNRGFKWSDGTGAMGQGWCATFPAELAQEILNSLLQNQEIYAGRNDIRYKQVKPRDRFSERAEFKAVKMISALKANLKKRGREDDLQEEKEAAQSNLMKNA